MKSILAIVVIIVLIVAAIGGMYVSRRIWTRESENGHVEPR